MKKIVALVLCLALVLALGTVAFATNAASYVNGKAYAVVEGNVGSAEEPANVSFVPANATQKKVAHYEIGNGTYVVTDKASEASYAVRSGESWLYLKAAAVGYTAEGKLVGKTVKADDATCKAFYNPLATNTKGEDVASYVVDDDTVYVVVKAGAGEQNLLIDGKLYRILADAATKDHAWKYGFADDKVTVTGRTCPVCGKSEKAISYNEWLLLGATKRDDDNAGNYFEIVASAAQDGKTQGVTSAKTFDAGVAMYAGLALMSVAGSAVVIGKKKEF